MRAYVEAVVRGTEGARGASGIRGARRGAADARPAPGRDSRGQAVPNPAAPHVHPQPHPARGRGRARAPLSPDADAAAGSGFRARRVRADEMTTGLAGETSPYLLQHAHNPVDWYPWGSEAQERARREGKPLLLSVGYSACHWCHVMAHESFEDPDVAAVMNELFVNVKVDREERPDVDAIYMEAVQAMSGSGGWPMTVFMSAAGRTFFGGLFFARRTTDG